MPFAPSKVLERVSQYPQIDVSLPRSTTPEAAAPFENPALVTSPIDIQAYRATNQELTRIASEPQPLISTPARHHVSRLAKSVEELHARNTILQKEYDALKGVVNA